MHNQLSHAGLASLVQSRGRGNDSMLVHMTPDEVKGLHALTLAAGGMPTVNPATGLYEFGFLSKLLPSLLGVGLNFMFPGLGALGSGLLVGGVETARTGDLGKGLMAGLGAYGGAGLSSGLQQVGLNAASKPLETAAQGLNAAQGTSAAIGAGSDLSLLPEMGSAAAQTGAGAAANPALSSAYQTAAGNFSKLAGSPFEAAKAGLGNLTQPGALKTIAQSMGPAGLAGFGTNVMSAMTPDVKFQGEDPATMEARKYYWQSLGYDPNQGKFLGGQFTKGYPGLPGYAEGGSIPAPNPMYPQSSITKSSYAPALGYNKPSELIDGYEPKINPFTGEERFDDGGPVGGMPQQMAPTMMPQMSVDSGQSLADYYRGLMSAPQTYGPSQNDLALQDYMAGLNRFVTAPGTSPAQKSPTNAYKPPVTPPTQPPVTPPTQPPVTPPTQPPVTPPTQPPVTPPKPPAKKVGRYDPDTGEYIEEYVDDTEDPTKKPPITPTKPTQPTGPEDQYDPSNTDWDTVDLSGLQDLGIDPTSYREQMKNLYGKKTTPTTPAKPTGTTTTGPTGNYDPDTGEYIPGGTGQTAAQKPTGALKEPASLEDLADVDATESGQYNPYAKYQPGMDIWSRYGLNGSTMPVGARVPKKATEPEPDMGTQDFQFDPSMFGPVGGGDPGLERSPFQPPDESAAAATQESTPDISSLTTSELPDWYKQLYGGDLMGGNFQAFAGGGQLGGYSDGGQMLRGPGDGMSDNIPAEIRGGRGKQPARLADGEFVVPADVVSHLGNGSSEAGSRKLYEMMDQVRRARTGTNKQAKAIKAKKFLPR